MFGVHRLGTSVNSVRILQSSSHQFPTHIAPSQVFDNVSRFEWWWWWLFGLFGIFLLFGNGLFRDFGLE
jgi:hypothetical protein